MSGEPIIKDTRTPARAIVELWRTGIAPGEITRRLPHLTPAQIFGVKGEDEVTRALDR